MANTAELSNAQINANIKVLYAHKNSKFKNLNKNSKFKNLKKSCSLVQCIKQSNFIFNLNKFAKNVQTIESLKSTN